MSDIVFGLLAAAAGAATSLQSAANAGLAARSGLPAALVLNAAVVLLGALAFHLVRGANGMPGLSASANSSTSVGISRRCSSST